MGTNGFRYKMGDRPLEGYTIQRGVGRGGFGEVYFAISDSGRQVAIKSVHTYEKIELRGISQCMNLKSPHLVTIFDIKYNDEGRPFVIMEYVAGPSLADLLNRSPGGLGEQKAAYFIREIAKGLTYLHDRGIVHRDLKPGNIFYDNGYVMIGDYGLSKIISSNQHSAQTVTVGTVHYMAPEIGAGQYDRTIDIYALGVLLYEMLTGHVPFVGASLGEILMKHLASEVDVSSIREPFASIIKKAMAKNPADRYPTAQAMVEDLFGVDHIRNSVSVFSPDSLTIVAGQAAVGVAAASGSDEEDNDFGPEPTDNSSRRRVQMDANGVTVANNGQRVHVGVDGIRVDNDGHHVHVGAGGVTVENDDRRVGGKKNKKQWQHADRDPIPISQRLMLAAIAIGAVSMAIGAVSMRTHTDIVSTVLASVGAMVGALLGVAGAAQRILPRFNREKGVLFNLTYGGLASTGVALLAGPVALMSHNDMLVKSIGTVMAAVYFLNFAKRTSPTRRERITSDLAVSAGAFALFLNWIIGGDWFITIGCIVGISLASQAMSPFRPRLLDQDYRSPLTDDERLEAANFKTHLDAARESVVGTAAKSANAARAQAAAARHTASQATRVAEAMRATDQVRAQTITPKLVPVGVKIFWLIAFLFFMSASPALFLAGGILSERNGGPAFAMAGFPASIAAITSLIVLRRRNFISRWSGLIKPATICLMMVICGVGAFSLAITPRGPEKLIALVLTIFPIVVSIVLLFLPANFFSSNDAARQTVTTSSGRVLHPRVSPHSRGLALGLTLLCFCGASGVHRLVVGKVGTGILWLLTFGLLGFGQLIDFIMILAGTFSDKQGRFLMNWELNTPRTPQIYSTEAPTRPQVDIAGVVSSTAESIAQAATTTAHAVGAAIESTAASISSVRHRRANRPASNNHPVLASLAVLTLLLSLVAAIIPVWHLPTLAKEGAPILIELNGPLAQSFNTPDWPIIIERVTMMLAMSLLFVAMLEMMLARRHANAIHILRVPIGAGLIVAAIAATRSASAILATPTGIAGLRELFDGQHIGHGIITIINLTMSPTMFGAAFLILAAMTVLGWPKSDEKTIDTAERETMDVAAIEPDGGNA